MSDVQYFLYIHQTAVIAVLTTIGFAGLMIDLAFRSEKHDLGKIGKNLQVAGKVGEYVFVVSMAVCALSVIATPGKSFPKEHLHQETIPVAKVSHISGSDNYLIQGTNGKSITWMREPLLLIRLTAHRPNLRDTLSQQLVLSNVSSTIKLLRMATFLNQN